MPGPIKLIVRPSEKNAAELYYMQQHYLKVIQTFIKVRNEKDSDTALQKLKKTDLPLHLRSTIDIPLHFTNEEAVREDVAYKENLPLSTILASILANTPTETAIFHNTTVVALLRLTIVSDGPSGEVNRENLSKVLGENKLKLAIVLQMMAYALVERFRENPAELRPYFEACLEQFSKLPTLYFPALSVFMDAKHKDSDQFLISLTDNEVQKIKSKLETSRFNQKNFPYEHDQGQECLSFSSENHNAQSARAITAYLDAIPFVNLTPKFYQKVQNLNLPPELMKLNLKAFLGSAAVALAIFIIGMLFLYFLSPGLETVIVRVGLLIPSALALTVMGIIGYIKLIINFGPRLFQDMEERIDKIKDQMSDLENNLKLDILQGHKILPSFVSRTSEQSGINGFSDPLNSKLSGKQALEEDEEEIHLENQQVDEKKFD